jgi:hypothetical protein
MLFNTLSNGFDVNHGVVSLKHERLRYEPSDTYWTSRIVTRQNGPVAFNVNHKRCSRTTSVCDGNGIQLFEFRYKPHWFKQATYSAYSSCGGFNGLGSNRLWEMNHTDQSARSKWNVISFTDSAPGKPFEGLSYRQKHRGRLAGELLRGGQVMATVERTSIWSRKYDIEGSPGIDMALVVGIEAAVDDKIGNEGSAT